MPALTIAALVTQYGIPFTEYLIQLWQNKQAVGADEWAKLKTLVQTPETALNNAVKALGLSTDDPKVQEVTNLIR